MTLNATSTPNFPPSARSRILGVVLGAAVGDALGHPTEFLSHQQIRTRFGPYGVTGFAHWSVKPQGGHRAPGTACMRGAGRLRAGVPWREAGGSTDGGCGSVMRAYPFGLLFYDDIERAEHWAVEHSRMTHQHPIALAACAAMAVGMVHEDDLRALAEAAVDVLSMP